MRCPGPPCAPRATGVPGWRCCSTGYRAERLSGTQLFVLPEVVLDGQGLLAEDLVAPVSAWLAELAGDPSTRVRVVGDTLGGALAALRWGVEDLAEAVD